MMKRDENSSDVRVPEEKIFQVLEDAIVYDNPDILERTIVHYGVDVNKPRADGTTLAMLAASLVRPNALRVLEKHGARLDVTDNNGRGLLHHICAFRDYYDAARMVTREMKRRMKQRGKLNMWDVAFYNRYMPICYYLLGPSFYEGRVSLLRFLVKEKGLDVNAKDHNGDTPLTLSLKALAKPLAEELVRLGANPYMVNNDMRNAVDIANECDIDLKSLFPSRNTLSL